MEDNINSSDGEVEGLETKITVNTDCVAETTAFIAELDGDEGRIAKQNNILVKATAMCASFEAEYESTTAGRN